MISNSEIRARARQTLGGKIFGDKWLYAVLVYFIACAISSAASWVSLASILILGPMAAGLSFVFLKATRTGEKIKVEDMFCGFKDFGENLLLGLMVSLFTFLWSLLFIVPGIIKAISYSMTFYIKNDHPEYDWRTCMKESQRMTNGYKGKLFGLGLSFIGWIIVGSLCLGIGTLWVAPYIASANAEFYNLLKAKEDPFIETEETVDEEFAL